VVSAQPSDDERHWVERARSRDPEAIGWLYERYFDRIYRYVFLKVGKATDAEDITELVFLKMLEAIGAFKWQGSTFASWLFRIAHNQIVDHMRQHARHPQVPIEPAGALLQSEGDDPHWWAEQSDFRAHLEACIEQLTELQALVINLKFGAGLSNAEVAQAMNRTEGAIKALQFSALQNLNKLMKLRGY
jgi:RNA polymerase sigma-70 factor (ECF subfamily)